MLRWIERVLLAAGFLLLGYCGTSWIDSRFRQIEGSRELDRLLLNPPKAPAAMLGSKPLQGELIGRVAVPRLGLSAIVFEGTDDAVLHRGVGHLTGSALPGQPGNVVLAGHRDSFFRDLRNIRKGDLVDVTTAFGTRSYAVESTEVVDPTEIGVEAPTSAPTLTLITCYPFNFVGNAPQRFIIRAQPAQENAAQQPAPPEERTAQSNDPPKLPRYVSYAIYADSSAEPAIRQER
jgi:sortase A